MPVGVFLNREQMEDGRYDTVWYTIRYCIWYGTLYMYGTHSVLAQYMYRMTKKGLWLQQVLRLSVVAYHWGLSQPGAGILLLECTCTTEMYRIT